MSSSFTFPIYACRSGWNAILPARTWRTRQAILGRYEYAIIGAGYTGLALARRIAEIKPNAQIVVFESTEIGEGASARNSGFLISTPHNTGMSGHRASMDVAYKQIRLYEHGLAWLSRIVDRYKIQCNWNNAGKLHCATTMKGERSLRNLLTQLRSWGIDAVELGGSELEERLGTNYYRYGIHTSHNVFVQPASLIRGLADTLPENVTILENTPVMGLSGKRPYNIDVCPNRIKADNVVLANNGFARALGFLKDRLITFYTYAGMTPVLDHKQLSLHGALQEWGVIPANRLGATLRKTQGARFLVRTAFSYEKPIAPHVVRAILTNSYRKRYPSLKRHELEYLWGGATAITRNGATYFGQLDTGLYASVGCNGAGVLKGTVYGKLLAEFIAGNQSQELSDALMMTNPSWLPPEPVRQLAVKAAVKLEEERAGAERY